MAGGQVRTGTKEGSERGRDARWPSEIPATGWRDIAWRIWTRIEEDRLMLIAAGVSFYLVLAIFPALAAFVSLYGLIADPATIAGHLSLLQGLLPMDAMEILEAQLAELSTQDADWLSMGFLIALLIAFWSTGTGVKSLFDSLNVAYGEQEKRSFVRLNLVALVFTLAVMAGAVVLIAIVGIVPVVMAALPAGDLSEPLLRYLRWPVMFVLVAVGISVLYHFGPSRKPPRWRWTSWGGIFASLAWIGGSAAFSFYLENFADYSATYGSLGAAVGFLMWIWVSVLVVLVGAEINAEMEHQTGRDSTTGPPRPMGQRGAHVADTLGAPAEAMEEKAPGRSGEGRD